MRILTKRQPIHEAEFPDVEIPRVRAWAKHLAQFRRDETLDELLNAGRLLMPGIPTKLRDRELRAAVNELTAINVPDVYRLIRAQYNSARSGKVTMQSLLRVAPGYKEAEISRVLQYLIDHDEQRERQSIPAPSEDEREPEVERGIASLFKEAGTQTRHPRRRTNRTPIRRGG